MDLAWTMGLLRRFAPRNDSFFCLAIFSLFPVTVFAILNDFFKNAKHLLRKKVEVPMAKKVFLMSLLVAGSCFAEASLFKTVGATNDVLSLWSRFSALLTDKNPTNDQASAYQVDEVRKGDTIQFKLQGVAMRKKFAEDSANEEAWQQFGIAVMEAAGRCETYRGTLVMPEEFDSDEPVSGNRDWILRIRHDVPATGNPQDREIVHFWAGYKSFQCQNIRD